MKRVGNRSPFASAPVRLVYLTLSTASNSIYQDISTIGSQSLPVGVATPWGKVAARGTSASAVGWSFDVTETTGDKGVPRVKTKVPTAQGGRP